MNTVNNNNDESSEKTAKYLEKWYAWIEERKRLHRKLGEKLNRSPGELVMNIGEELKSIKEEQLVIQYSEIPQSFHRFLGNPAFFKLPVGLPEYDSCCNLTDPVYFSVLTKTDKNEIPEIEYVSTPLHIMQEKDILPRSRNILKGWKDIDYRKKITEKLEEEITNIEPHKPQTEDIIIIGRGLFKDASPEIIIDSKLHETQSAHETESEAENKAQKADSTEVVRDVKNRVAFLINTVLFFENMERDKISKIYINFDHDVALNSISTKYITIENVGSATVTLSWIKEKKYDMFADIKKNKCVSSIRFFFNRNEILLIPGEKYILPIWLKTNVNGSFSEAWKININPPLLNVNSVSIVLNCNSFIGCFLDKNEKIKQTLTLKAKYRAISEVIQECLNKGLSYKEKECFYESFTEEQIFEARNFDKNLKNCPLVSYNPEIINRLKLLYKNIYEQPFTDEWDLSIASIAQLCRIKDIRQFQAMRMQQAKLSCEKRLEQEKLRAKYIAEEIKKNVAQNTSKINVTSKKSNNDKDKKDRNKITEKGDTSKKSRDKFKNGKNKESTLSFEKDKNQKIISPLDTGPYSYYQELTTMLKKLRDPVTIRNNNRVLYFQAFSVLQYYFSHICEKIENLETELKYPQHPIKVQKCLKNIPDRLIYEKFDDSFHFDNSHKLPLRKYEYLPKPRHRLLEEITTDDIELIYDLYFLKNEVFNKSQSKLKDIKSKTDASSKEKKDSKSKEKDKSKSKITASTTSRTERLEHVQIFDPYAETYIAQDLSKDTDTSREEDIIIEPVSVKSFDEATSCIFKHNLYAIFYTYLSNAVDALTETCDQFRDTTFSSLSLYRISNSETRRHDLDGDFYNRMISQRYCYPPSRRDLLDNEAIQDYIIRGAVKPTKAETCNPSLWDVFQVYKPFPETPEQSIRIPTPSVPDEPPAKDVQLQANLKDCLLEDKVIDYLKQLQECQTEDKDEEVEKCDSEEYWKYYVGEVNDVEVKSNESI